MSFSYHLENLPSERIVDIALSLPLSIIKSFSQTSKKFNQLICENDEFWRRRFIKDYNYDPVDSKESWKELYKNSGNVWTFGWNIYGKLGLGDNIDKSMLTQIPNLKAKEVSAGGNHTVIIDLENNI